MATHYPHPAQTQQPVRDASVAHHSPTPPFPQPKGSLLPNDYSKLNELLNPPWTPEDYNRFADAQERRDDENQVTASSPNATFIPRKRSLIVRLKVGMQDPSKASTPRGQSASAIRRRPRQVKGGSAPRLTCRNWNFSLHEDPCRDKQKLWFPDKEAASVHEKAHEALRVLERNMGSSSKIVVDRKTAEGTDVKVLLKGFVRAGSSSRTICPACGETSTPRDSEAVRNHLQADLKRYMLQQPWICSQCHLVLSDATMLKEHLAAHRMPFEHGRQLSSMQSSLSHSHAMHSHGRAAEVLSDPNCDMNSLSDNESAAALSKLGLDD